MLVVEQWYKRKNSPFKNFACLCLRASVVHMICVVIQVVYFLSFVSANTLPGPVLSHFVL